MSCIFVLIRVAALSCVDSQSLFVPPRNWNKTAWQLLIDLSAVFWNKKEKKEIFKYEALNSWVEFSLEITYFVH